MILDCPGCKTKNIQPSLDNSRLWPVFRCPVCNDEIDVPFGMMDSTTPKNVVDAVKKNSQGMYASAIKMFGVVTQIYLTSEQLSDEKLDAAEKGLIEDYQAQLTTVAFSEVRRIFDILPSEVKESEELDWRNAIEGFKKARKKSADNKSLDRG